MRPLTKYSISIIFLICFVQINFFIQRHEFAILFATYAVFFGTYLYVLKNVETPDDRTFFLNIGLILRGIAILSFPNLSDDIYRFLWDGHLVNLGENPFSHTPQYYADNHLFSDRLTPELYSKLNSPNYYSVYPTVCQAVFAASTYLFPKSIYGATIVIKLFLFACEAGTVFLIKKLNTDKIGVLIYALNPLIIIELVGNAHFEAAMIFFFMLAISILTNSIDGVTWSHPVNRISKNRNLFYSSVIFSLSVVSKMLPLMYLPLLFKRLGWKRSFFYWTMVFVLTLILCIPIYNSLFVNNIGKSLALYFNNFQFNASLFYIINGVCLHITHYNMIERITPYLTLTVIIFIFKKAFLEKSSQLNKNWTNIFFEDCLLVTALYFACATTVHPWYAVLPLACSVFTKWRFPLVWTFFIILTYAGYTEGSSKHTENMAFLIIEYSAVYGYFLYECFKILRRG